MTAEGDDAVVASSEYRHELVDLHNHSYWSYDSSNRLVDYQRAHAKERFDILAITDHNTIEGALEFAALAEFQVIVGEEIDTADGELIGLFLERPLVPGRSAIETAEQIRGQGGLVYVQHPFYRLIRRRLSFEIVQVLVDRGLVDVVEVANGGPFMRESNRRAALLAAEHDIPGGAGSDAHHPRDIGTCVVALPGGPLTAASIVHRLRKSVVVNNHRNPVTALSARGAYTAHQALRRRIRGAETRSRAFPSRGENPKTGG